MPDQGTNLENFVKHILNQIDTVTPQTISSFQVNFSPSSKIIINKTPVPAPNAASVWCQHPLSQHSLTSLDWHGIPGLQTCIVQCNAKVRYDESGKARDGSSALLIPDNNATARAVWGSWFGVYITIICNVSALQGDIAAAVESINYEIVYKAEDSLVVV